MSASGSRAGDETADFGPCGWGYLVFVDPEPALLDGEDVFTLAEQAKAVGRVALRDFPDKTFAAYEVMHHGKAKRFALGEIQMNLWCVASVDFGISETNSE
ncbi:hypothetical protein [Pelagimonas phthalicica]|uniref:hypothetical protein n=1 Tax=Pelagimonas phthalicica TaxID=1037362 RepID=UPI000C06E811|nr:hypothetical protein [Pelagimonas phthalicica]